MKTLPASMLLLGTTLFAAELPLEEPFGLWLRHMEAAGDTLFGAIAPGHAPLSAEGALAGLSEDLMRRSGRPDMNFFSPSVFWGMEAALQGSFGEDAFENSAGVKFRLAGTLAEGLTFDHQASLWTGSDDLPPGGFSEYHIHPNQEPGRHLYTDWGYLDYGSSRVSVRLGRFAQQWGPGRFTQLLVSDNSPPLDQLRACFRISDRVSFSGFTSTIEPDSGSWFCAHRLDILPADNLRLGVYEAAFYTTTTFDFAYSNPILFWYAVQWNEQDDDNLFMGLDATWKPAPHLAAYMEWLIDDIQYQTTYNRPNKMGGTIGIDWASPSSGLALTAEYTAIAKYVYSQKHLRNIFLHNDRIIGSEIGPDADRATLSLGYAGLWPMTAELRGSLSRHGVGTVYDGFGDTVVAGEPWPSGIIEYTRDIELNLSYRLSGEFTLYGSAGYASMSNAGNVQDSTASDTRASLRLVYGI